MVQDHTDPHTTGARGGRLGKVAVFESNFPEASPAIAKA